MLIDSLSKQRISYRVVCNNVLQRRAILRLRRLRAPAFSCTFSITARTCHPCLAATAHASEAYPNAGLRQPRMLQDFHGQPE
ncbi:hypothetical protein NJI34_13725 [Pseudomonas sp. S 311-6]|nr:hypothetical protein [Pseudomonas sp. S 311-6]